MDFLNELESMASNAARDYSEDSGDEEPSQKTIEIWQKLFDYSYTDASDAIKDHRNNMSRIGVSDEHWKLIQEKQEALGYTREAYEHELGRSKFEKIKPSSLPTSKANLSQAQSRAIYTIKLEGPLDTPDKIQEAAGLDEKPLTIQGESIEDETVVSFCRINGTAKFAITNWLSANNISFRPMFARIQQKAIKDFHEDSRFPTLGVESTLPQFRATNHETKPLPAQIQYPVWYFFYGTLAQPEILSRQIGREVLIGRDLKEAYVVGGKLGTWGGKYKALVDESSWKEGRVEGMACEILGMGEEDALLVYETDNYEVVRCEIVVGGNAVLGCTFRFVGDAQGF